MSVLYSWFAILGMGVLAASMLMGLRYDPSAPAIHYAYNAGLFVGYMAVNYLMMTPAFKNLVAKSPQGSVGERRFYMFVAIVTWVVLYALHWPLPGIGYELPIWVTYFGYCAFLMSFFAFNEGATFDNLKAFAGAHGTEQTHGAALDAPLQTKGSYASVRHPMYRAAVCLGLSSLLINPHSAQLVWVAIIGVTFVSFIPIEERQLIAGRGDEYRQYMEVTRYLLFKGIW